MKNARVFLLALTAIVLSIPAFTQVATGTPSFGSFAGGPDVVNLGNLNADWTIPIRNKAGRGMNFVYNLQYDSSVFYPVASGSSMYWQPVGNWGWQGLTGSGLSYITYDAVEQSSATCNSGYGSYTVYQISNITYIDTYGAHPFPIPTFTSTFFIGETGSGCKATSNVPALPVSALASDGSGITISNIYVQNGDLWASITKKTGTVSRSLLKNVKCSRT
jgi:hypothetical protein